MVLIRKEYCKKDAEKSQQFLLIFLYFSLVDALSSTEHGTGIGALGSSSSFRDKTVLENVILWPGVVRRYRNLKSDIPTK